MKLKCIKIHDKMIMLKHTIKCYKGLATVRKDIENPQRENPKK